MWSRSLARRAYSSSCGRSGPSPMTSSRRLSCSTRSRSAAQIRSFTRFSGTSRPTTPINFASAGSRNSRSSASRDKSLARAGSHAARNHRELLRRQAVANAPLAYRLAVRNIPRGTPSEAAFDRPFPAQFPPVDVVLARNQPAPGRNRAEHAGHGVPSVHHIRPQPAQRGARAASRPADRTSSAAGLTVVEIPAAANSAKRGARRSSAHTCTSNPCRASPLASTSN